MADQVALTPDHVFRRHDRVRDFIELDQLRHVVATCFADP
jgi:hypothetical protein